MKAKELDNKSKDELMEMLKEKRAKLVEFRFDVASRQLKNHAQISETRKDIARIMTKLKETK